MLNRKQGSGEAKTGESASADANRVAMREEQLGGTLDIVQALANGEMSIVAHFFREVGRGGFCVARSGSRWLFAAF